MDRSINGDARVIGEPTSWPPSAPSAAITWTICSTQASVTVESAEVKAAVQWMADNVLKHEVQPSPALNLAELGIEFGSGVIGMGMAAGGSVENIRPGREYPFGWDFVPLPAGPEGFIVWGDTDQSVTSSTTPKPRRCLRMDELAKQRGGCTADV